MSLRKQAGYWVSLPPSSAHPLGAKDQRDRTPEHRLSEELWSRIIKSKPLEIHTCGGGASASLGWDPLPVHYSFFTWKTQRPEALEVPPALAIHRRAMKAEGLVTAMRCHPSWPNAYFTHLFIPSPSLSQRQAG